MMIAPMSPVPPIPSAIALPETKDLVTVYFAVGVQLYQYQRQTDGSLKWVSTGVDAKLFDTSGNAVGTHTTGPMWSIAQGSFKATKLAETNAANPESIPWLLLRVSERNPASVQVDYVQRVFTAAGMAPPATLTAAEGTTYGSPYSAAYVFWGRVPHVARGGNL